MAHMIYHMAHLIWVKSLTLICPGNEKSESINFVPDKVEPVCIALDPPSDGEYCKVAGFGLTKGTSRDDQLNSGAIPMANFDTCSSSYAKYNFQLYEDQHLCFWSKGKAQMNTSSYLKLVERSLSLKKKALMLARVTLVDLCYAEIQDRLQSNIKVKW